jgi:hypothetical protein
MGRKLMIILIGVNNMKKLINFHLRGIFVVCIILLINISEYKEFNFKNVLLVTIWYFCWWDIVINYYDHLKEKYEKNK